MSLIRWTRFRFAERVPHQSVEEAFDPRVGQFRHFHLDQHVPRRGDHACVVLGLGVTIARGFYAPAPNRARDRGNDLLLEPQKQRPHLVTERGTPFEQDARMVGMRVDRIRKGAHMLQNKLRRGPAFAVDRCRPSP